MTTKHRPRRSGNTSVADQCLTLGERTLRLQRRPRRRNEVLQAWDSADRYLIRALQELEIAPDSRLLLVNDSFGALACALSDYRCVSWTDSAVARLATLENCAANACREPDFLPICETPTGDFAAVLMRFPRSHSLLRFQLQRIGRVCAAPASFIGATMAKYLDASLVQHIESNLGVAEVSLAWKKARVVRLRSLQPAAEPEDDRAVTDIPDFDLQLVNRANVFSRGKFDRGSQRLLSVLSKLNTPRYIADLGCGNGLLGIVAARHWPQSVVHFFDDSALAVDSARENCSRLMPASSYHFSHDDCMSAYDGPQFDLILCNPPFHQEQQLGDHIARQMFHHAHRHLADGGQLAIVANRHLPYRQTLQTLFAQVQQIDADAKFVVLVAEK